jgi:hypothetical protein
MGTIVQAGVEKSLIKFFKALSSWNRDKIIAPDISYQTFYSALLIGIARIAETGFKIIIGP